jgi:cell division septum initiation protein DivIVA
VDPLERIDEIAALVEGARSMPMSASCIVNREELLDLLDLLRTQLPAEVRQARAVLEERDEIIDAGHLEVERMVSGGLGEHRRLVSEAEVTSAAERAAAELLAEARGEADRLTAEAQEYVDSTLAEFERVLTRTLTTVERGRDRLQARTAMTSSAVPPRPTSSATAGDQAAT